MKIKPYVERLERSKEYKEFMNKYSDAFMVAGFFVIDLESGKNVHQIDFYMPSQKKVAAFTLDSGVNVQIMDMLKTKKRKLPEKLDLETNIDLDALVGILTDEMRNRSMSEDIKKIIAVIQNIEGKKIWNVNCVLSGMEVLKSHVEDESKTVLKIEKTSILDLVKKLPMNKLSLPKSKKDAESEMRKLKEIEAEIEKEREKLKGEIGKNKNLAEKKKPNKK